jgi:hypothetical protein
VSAGTRFSNYDCNQERGDNYHLSLLSPKYKTFDLCSHKDIHVV